MIAQNKCLCWGRHDRPRHNDAVVIEKVIPRFEKETKTKSLLTVKFLETSAADLDPPSLNLAANIMDI
jgi:hypothetical protein